ncbi:alpha/beta hydrolase-fold protein [Brevundimonas sp.]|uniref:alpha/beta hydrolase n=1 Tax=Brevundimonas sp. TaxID=1871086 RepID=UPI002897701A|nr:alpha/beta hydrolase-fold protein [Brevundimonas sp.]
MRVAASLAAGCGERADAQTTSASAAEGAPYVLKGTQVWSVPDPVSGRDYEVFVSLPASYEAEPNRRYPVLYVTDADYAFPIIRQIARRVNLDGPVIEEFILVGLSYAVGEGGMRSRTRDYTPVRINDRTGGGAAYQTYLKTQALPFIEDRFRADPARRILLGHSYGGLLGAQILFSEPELFDGYILGSPSFWFGDHAMMQTEAEYARGHTDLPARVHMYIGEYEHPGSGRLNTRYDMVGDNARFEERLRSRNYRSLTLTSEYWTTKIT